MGMMRAVEGGADPVSQFGSGQQAVRFGHPLFAVHPFGFTKTKLTPGRCIGSTKDWAVSSSYTQVIHWWARCCWWCGAIVNAANGSG
jgi:hypothetical protein